MGFEKSTISFSGGFIWFRWAVSYLFCLVCLFSTATTPFAFPLYKFLELQYFAEASDDEFKIPTQHLRGYDFILEHLVHFNEVRSNAVSLLSLLCEFCYKFDRIRVEVPLFLNLDLEIVIE